MSMIVAPPPGWNFEMALTKLAEVRASKPADGEPPAPAKPAVKANKPAAGEPPAPAKPAVKANKPAAGEPPAPAYAEPKMPVAGPANTDLTRASRPAAAASSTSLIEAPSSPVTLPTVNTGMARATAPAPLPKVDPKASLQARAMELMQDPKIQMYAGIAAATGLSIGAVYMMMRGGKSKKKKRPPQMMTA